MGVTGVTNSTYQWFGNIVLTDNDISVSGGSTAFSVYLAVYSNPDLNERNEIFGVQEALVCGKAW